MCLIKKHLKTKNLPKSVLGYKGFSLGFDGQMLVSAVFGRPVSTTKTNIAVSPTVNYNEPYNFKKHKGYSCGFHISATNKVAESWAYPRGNTKVVVGWCITAVGYQEWHNGKPLQKTYVARYMRVFDTLKEAKEFKRKLDLRLNKEK